jgi:hypothetical protein
VDVDAAAPTRRQKRVLSLVLIVHWGLAIPWIVPALNRYRPIPDLYQDLTAHYQLWWMFSSPKAQKVAWLVWVAEGEDGSFEEFQFPRVAQAGYWGGWRYARYREFEDRLRFGSPINAPELLEPARADAARYVAKRLLVERGMRAQRISLELRIVEVPEFGQAPAEWTDYVALLRYAKAQRCEVLHTYPVEPEDLGR